MSNGGERTARAAVWALIATAGTRIVTLVSLAVLARLLAPAEFGLLAFALVYITYAETIGDLGTGVALIYWPARRDDAAQVTFLINVAMGVFWCVLTLLLAPQIAGFFRNPDAAAIVRALAFAFLIKFLGNTHDALAQKDLRFRARIVPELGLAVVKAGVSIALAAAGFGAWSLVWGHLAGMTMWTIGAWLIVPWRPSLTMPHGLAGPMLRYGQGIVGVNILAAIVHHADLAVVGRMLGAAALGAYQIAYKIPEATITVIIWVVGKVLFPSFSRLQHDTPALRRAYLAALTYVSLVTIPSAAGLFIVADPLVRVFFGERWAAAIPILEWLAIYAGIRSIGTHAGDILKATGRSGVLASLSAARAAVLVPALIFAARVSAERVATTLAVVTAASVVINIGIVMRLLDIRAIDVVMALRTPLIAGAFMTIATVVVAGFDGTLAPPWRIAAIVGTGAATYAAAVYATDRNLFRDLRRILPSRSREARAGEAEA